MNVHIWFEIERLKCHMERISHGHTILQFVVNPKFHLIIRETPGEKPIHTVTAPSKLFNKCCDEGLVRTLQAPARFVIDCCVSKLCFVQISLACRSTLGH